MWKDSYRIGVDRIDQQHMKLFEMVEGLVNDVTVGAPTEKYREAVNFLKEYVVFHFQDEENYQREIRYSGLKAHQWIHQDFTNTVLDFVKVLEQRDYSLSMMQELAGMLTAWLICHVAGADQRIVGKEPKLKSAGERCCLDDMLESIEKTILRAAEFSPDYIRRNALAEIDPAGDFFVSVPFAGDIRGRMIFGFTEQFISQLLGAMLLPLGNAPERLTNSALSELVNHAAVNAVTALSNREIRCMLHSFSVTRPPKQLPKGAHGILPLDSGIDGLWTVFQPG